MRKITPAIVQYQGSKRKIAPQILQYMPLHSNRLIEPFSGMAAISIASAFENRADEYVINDVNAPLIKMLEEAVNNPEKLVADYSKVWEKQFEYSDHVQHFYDVRDEFNAGIQSPENILYLIARCVKGAVRYSSDGRFNQSPDKRRHGTRPETLKKNILSISQVMKGKAKFYSLDYREILKTAKPGDLVYMDPPYQGVSNVRDNRYFSGVSFDEFAKSLDMLNKNNIDFIVSYDGTCGGKEYGQELPEELQCTKIMINAGLSSQATLLGRKSTTFEALYLSRGLTVPTIIQSKEEYTGALA